MGDGVQPLGEQGGVEELKKKYVEEEPQDLAVDEEKLKLSKYRHLTAETSFILLLHLTGHQTEDYRRNCQKGKFLFL